ncbi:MAG: hypothetical protein KIT62_11610 [Cyclobacteriaceae bacterium]|nr:hypothetical protein [Cyclobacteriaceae bacterium]
MHGFAYRVYDQHGVYFVTFTVHQWVDVDYIHCNPVRAGIVEKEEEYLLGSCCDFYGTRRGLLEL